MKRIQLTHTWSGLELLGYDPGVPGLAVVKQHYGGLWSIYHAPSGHLVSDHQVCVYGRRKDAVEACKRLASLADWTLPVSNLQALHEDMDWRDAMRKALIGPELLEQRRQAKERTEYRNTGQEGHDLVEDVAERHGHEDVRPGRYGQRSYKGKCRRCGLEIRAAWEPMSERYDVRGEGAHMSCERVAV